MNINDIAKIAHELNRSFCISIGDTSQPEWIDAPNWQKESAVEGVKYHIENTDSNPEDSHRNWLKGKKADGWSFGMIKDSEKKEHPCMVEYLELPIEQRSKDYLFSQIIKSLEEFVE